MNILIKKRNISTSHDGTRELNGNTETYNIPNTTITGISFIYLIVNVIANILSNYMAGVDKRVQDKRVYQLLENHFQLQLLQRVLESDSIKDRRHSLYLLEYVHLLGNKNEQLLKYLDSSKYIAKWPKINLESTPYHIIGGGENKIEKIKIRDSSKQKDSVQDSDLRNNGNQ